MNLQNIAQRERVGPIWSGIRHDIVLSNDGSTDNTDEVFLHLGTFSTEPILHMTVVLQLPLGCLFPLAN